jgi:hypothetical protein
MYNPVSIGGGRALFHQSQFQAIADYPQDGPKLIQG